MPTTMRARAASLLLATGLVATLAACSSSDTTSDSACGPVAAGDISKGVTVTGDFGTKQTVQFTAPAAPTTTQRSVLIEGDGEVEATTNTFAVIKFSLYNGESGEYLLGSEYTEDTRPDEFFVNQNAYFPGLISTLQCSSVGDRVVGVIPASEAYGETGNEQLGIGANESLVFVADVLEVNPGWATGVDQDVSDSSLPSVTLDEEHVPTVKIPDAEPTGELSITVLKEGDGEVVGDADYARIQYQGTNWTSGVLFDQSWNKNQPPSYYSVAGYIPGFTQAIVGQKIGSQILVVIPPELGYGEAGQPGAGIGGTDTLVFVIDILDALPPDAQ